MDDYKTWDELTDVVSKYGNICSFKADVLLKIYGTHIATVDVNNDIRNSLLRRGYDMQPRSLSGLSKDSWVRIYSIEAFEGIIAAVQSTNPGHNQTLRKWVQESQRTLKIQELIGLAKEISKES